MKKLQLISVVVILLNVFIILAGVTMSASRLGWLEQSGVFVIAPSLCFLLAWFRFKRAPKTSQGNKANFVALLAVSLLAAALAYMAASSGHDPLRMLIVPLILFFSFSADIVVENLQRP